MTNASDPTPLHVDPDPIERRERRVPIPPEAASRLRQLKAEAEHASRAAGLYLEALAVAYGEDPARLLAVDDGTDPALILRTDVD